jgi:hypothetical protein
MLNDQIPVNAMMRAKNQNEEFSAAYGEALFYAHLIEDLVALHIYECGYFHVNGYYGLSSRRIRNLKYESQINELLSAPVKPGATRVRVPPVELDCSRPKAESGKKP